MHILGGRLAGLAALISVEVDFRTRNVTRDEGNDFRTVKEYVHYEHATILNVHAASYRHSKVHEGKQA